MSSTVLNATAAGAGATATSSVSSRKYMTLSPAQTTALALIPIPSAILSFISSILIIRSIERKRRQSSLPYANNNNNNDGPRSHHRRRPTTAYAGRRLVEKPGPYERIIYAMSCYDMLFTAVIVWSPFLTPTGYWWPSPNHFGNENTCRFIGTMFQFSIANVFYYGLLGFYFLLTIRFHVRKETFVKRVEVWVHGFIIFFSVSTSLAGGIINFYDELALFPGCWIDNYPKGCSGDTCQSPLIAWILAGIPFCVVIVSLIVNYLTILCYVTKRYKRHSPPVALSSSSRTNVESTARRQSFDGLSSMFFLSGRRQQAQEQEQQHADDDADNDVGPSDGPDRFNLSSSSRPERLISGTLHPTGQANRVRLVSTQAYLYISTFFLTYTWIFTLQVIESTGNAENFPFFVFFILQAVFMPLAGFWNALVFFRPRYILLRRYYVRRYERELQLQQLNTLSTDSSIEHEDGDDIRLVPRWKIVFWVVFGENDNSNGSPSVQPTTLERESMPWYRNMSSCVLQYLRVILCCHPSQTARVSEGSCKSSSRPSVDDKLPSVQNVSNNSIQDEGDVEDDTVSRSRDNELPSIEDNDFEINDDDDITDNKNILDGGNGNNGHDDYGNDDCESSSSYSSVLRD
mmetsp:Transcript_19752/g.47721  ORF Transcript_19752/g.47721 Transcript_19752/m.47721 type:complete len:630 (+) Transcript_19752:241-2130(+)